MGIEYLVATRNMGRDGGYQIRIGGTKFTLHGFERLRRGRLLAENGAVQMIPEAHLHDGTDGLGERGDIGIVPALE